jgi:opacity protein-like surface antigen
MWLRPIALWMGLVVIAPASPATAQPAPERRVSVSALGGVAAASGTGGATVGAALGFDVAPRVALEARGLWLDRGVGISGGELTANVLVDLLTTRQAVPYLVAGGGVYHAQFDLNRQQLLGGMGNQCGPGSRLIPIHGTSSFGMMGANEDYGGHMWSAAGQGSTYTASQMPAFYANRMGRMLVPASGMWDMRGFTDPAVAVGGGVRMNLTDRVWLRPEARALVVLADGRSYTFGTVSFGLGLEF